MGARTLVVGTTPDYIQWIESFYKKKVLFLTDESLRKRALEPAPDLEDEVCWDLSDTQGAIQAVEQHLEKFKIKICAITSFDCESMELASSIAIKHKIFFQTPEAIRNSRDKFASKKVWESALLNIPKYALLNSEEDAEKFYRCINSPCVLKPLSGAGSELVFRCKTSDETKKAFSAIKDGLVSRWDNRLYNSYCILNKLSVLAEEFVEGTEYSCDFVIVDGSAKIIRLTEKIKLNSLPFGIIAGYKLTGKIPEISHNTLLETVTKAAESAKINKAICMLDFIVRDGKIFLIEIAPRPGGDCLPSLLLCASGQNILKMNIDLAAGKEVEVVDYRKIKELTALRIFAPKNGMLKDIDTSELKKDSTVIEINLTAHTGHNIQLPPEDYDSWILGNYILKLEGESCDLAEVYTEYIKQIKLTIK